MDQENIRIIVPHVFVQKLQAAFASCAFVFISAHTGWGKTSVVEALLADRPHTYVSLWERDALKRAGEDTTGLIVLDDFHGIYDYEDGEAAVLSLLRALPPDTRCILLSRADFPEWLLPFIETMQMEPMQYPVLALDKQEIQQLLEAYEFSVPSPEELAQIRDLTQGNPTLVLALGDCASGGQPFSQEVITQARELFFPFLDRHLFRFWDPMETRLLLLASYFDSFTIEMARVLTGNPDVEAVVERLRQTGSFLSREEGVYRFRFPLMRAYLQQKAAMIYRNEADLRGVYDVLSLCCQLSGDYDGAVSYSVQAKNRIRTAELLTAYIRSSPRDGIRAMKNVWQEIEEYDRDTIPELLCGMSMVCSMEGWADESEDLLARLERMGANIYTGGKTSRTARRFAAYLHLHLPHRTNDQRGAALPGIVEDQEHGAFRLPAFSITDDQPSVLRGLWDLSDWPVEEHPAFRRLMEQQYGKFASDILCLIQAERVYERGDYPWERVMDVGSVQLNASYGSQMPLEFAAVALAARLVCTQQDLPLAESITTAIQSRIRENGHTALIPCADALVCRVSLLGDGVYADTWYHQQTPESVKPSVQNRYPCLTMARCCIRRQEYQRADTLLEWLTGPLKSEGRVLDVIESLLLSAVCRRRMGIGEDTWRPLLIEAMEIAQPYGYTALFAELGVALFPLLREISWPEHQEFLAQLRQAVWQQVQRYPGYLTPFNGGTAYHPSLPADLLDEQETMLFCSICMRQTNEQIRESLGISGRQLTRLTSSLYAKLGTKSRKQIREMGMILIDENDNS